MYNKKVQIWGFVHRRRWRCVAFLVVFMLGTAGGTCWAVFFRTVASPVSLRDALRLYRRDQLGGSVGLQQSRPLSPGVYSYQTSGGESLSLLGVARSFPRHTNMVVTDGSNSCSAVLWLPIVQHTEMTTACPSTDGSFVVSDLVTHEQISGSTTTSVIDCSATTYLIPPHAAPGVRWTATCHVVSPSENVAVTGSVLGASMIDVGGHLVSTLHIRLVLVFAGIERGTVPTDFWISTSNGLIVRERELATITQQGVHYKEQMDTELTSLIPAT